MYESQIETIYENVQAQFEDAILKEVQKIGINVDKDGLTKALQYDREQYNNGYYDGWYAKEESIVRCKDCIFSKRDMDVHPDPKILNKDRWCELYGRKSPDWFCADGERREDE